MANDIDILRNLNNEELSALLNESVELLKNQNFRMSRLAVVVIFLVSVKISWSDALFKMLSSNLLLLITFEFDKNDNKTQ